MATTPSSIGARAGTRLYRWSAVIAALLVLAGYAQTYYLKALFGTPTLPLLVHVHGVAMSAWIALLVAQTWLVEARRVDLHRRLGVFGAVLLAVIPLLGVAVAVGSVQRHTTPPGIPPLMFLVIPLFDILLFATLCATGLWLRRQRDVHKRLMLMGTLAILPAAIARLPLDFVLHGGPLVFFGIADLIILACVAVDTVRNRRLHPAFGWSALLVIASHPLRLWLAGTAGWMDFAVWLVG